MRAVTNLRPQHHRFYSAIFLACLASDFCLLFRRAAVCDNVPLSIHCFGIAEATSVTVDQNYLYTVGRKQKIVRPTVWLRVVVVVVGRLFGEILDE